MTPLGLMLLANLRRLGQSPQLAVIVTDDWRYVQLAEDIGALAIHVKPEHHACDWTALAGLEVIYIPRAGDTPENLRMAKAIDSGRPQRMKSLLDGELTSLWYSREAA